MASASELTPEELAAERQAYRIKYYTLTQVGGLMILVSSIHPFYAANQLPGIFILTASVIYEQRKNAAMLTRRILLWGSLVAALWIGFNALNKWYLPPELVDTSSTLVPTFITAQQTVTFGYIGHFIVLIALIQGFRDLRLSARTPRAAGSS